MQSTIHEKSRAREDHRLNVSPFSDRNPKTETLYVERLGGRGRADSVARDETVWNGFGN
jgi:hypothetical protein